VTEFLLVAGHMGRPANSRWCRPLLRTFKVILRPHDQFPLCVKDHRPVYPRLLLQYIVSGRIASFGRVLHRFCPRQTRESTDGSRKTAPAQGLIELQGFSLGNTHAKDAVDLLRPNPTRAIAYVPPAIPPAISAPNLPLQKIPRVRDCLFGLWRVS
jgi:hypothetical protein